MSPRARGLRTLRSVRAPSLLLLVALALSSPLAAAEEEVEREGEGEGGELGIAAAWLLGLAIAFVPWNVLRRRVLVPRLRGRAADLKRLTFWSRRVILPVHAVLGTLALAVGTLHGFWAGASNPLLWAGLAVMALTVLGGALLTWNWVPGTVKKAAYLLHAQPLLLVARLALLVAGHALVDE